MYNLFPHLPKTSRLWIYQSNRNLNDREVEEISGMLSKFVSNWASHSREVKADGKIVYNQFVVLAADEDQFQVSGCSIDSSVSFIRSIHEKYKLDLFNRFNVGYKKDGEIATAGRDEFQNLIDEGNVNDETIVFNNMVNTIEQFETAWEVPFRLSWHARVFTSAAR